MMKWRIDHRIALKILAKAGTDARLLLLYFMIATAAISAFVSNTATAAMMLPIGMSVLVNIRNEDKADYGKALMLGIAYAASIGGVATLVGTPPNVILAGFVKSLLGKTITFLDWLKVGLPFAIIMLPITWKCLLINCKIKELEFDEENRLEKQLRVMGPLNSGQKIVIFVFALAALLWITQSFWHLIPLRIAAVIQSHVDDSAIAIICALLLFIIPTDIKEQRFPLDLGDMKHISWGILLLFGGGLCLGKGLFESGTAMWIAGFIPLSNGAHLILLMLLTIVVVSFLTEFASNTAVANMMIPILIAASHSLNVHPFCLAIPAAVACSIAFMLPISTPPNAIVYGSGYVSIQEMFKKGLLIHLIGVLVLVLLAYFLMGKVFGIIPV
jgi:sodium-dependent dicarboxylate transporter 2/3/5